MRIFPFDTAIMASIIKGIAIKSTTGSARLPGKIKEIKTMIGTRMSPAMIVAGSPKPTPSSTAINQRFLSASPSSSSLSFFLFFSTASARGPKALAKTPVIKGKMVITAASDMAKPRMPPQTSKLARFFKLPRIPIIIPSKKPRVMGSPKIPSLVFSDSGLSLTLLIPIRFHSGSNTKAGIKVSIL